MPPPPLRSLVRDLPQPPDQHGLHTHGVQGEIWAHLTVHHCLNRIIVRLADGEGLDPDRISFVKVLKHTRRGVVLQAGQSTRRLRQCMKRMATKVVREPDNRLRRPRAADRYTRHPVSQYIVRKQDQTRRGTRRVPEKVITLAPAILQQLKQRH
ncbi:hypothetical protein [Streptomyces sp. SID12488]|uniref:hypothetical protein n=1 Tax=Streptomyces sp. SID12488 TaxID=2706040 RepID=UPI0013DAE5FB|nr:hypothetical protein [Streptomyces sp. SID12488]NEA64055.1 hypothetical protein [Streptomyces sp. SID12488]